MTHQQSQFDHDPNQQSWSTPPQPTEFTATAPQATIRKPLLIAGVAALAVLFTGTIGYAVWEGFIHEDTGVAACKAMRDGKKMDGSEKTNGDDKMTEAEYREARAIFEESRYEKLEEHGTAIVDLAWQIQNLGDGNEMAALAFARPMGMHLSGLQSACADRGVIVNLSAG
ncbi:hypothetical protein [Micromonospora sagamiensis]|uniref:Uncharacterized protein n=1 Tax=Micromonospora sagamiensis TaxID=47875 RepID=A0A562WIG6_9ACTN|nr:hypothetical protein [Micromonospora sagamiensis]TWJ29938.1 hypothetical protein JD81_03469 [Micromonospora sagamiensis]BCL17034.1 hypothetical protein GCM10017556_47730 [Micromonospora sagamiensis]